MNDLTRHIKNNVGRDSVVGIATRYGMDVRGSNPVGDDFFPHPSRPALGPTQPPIQLVTCYFSGSKAAGAWFRPATHLAPRLKKEYNDTSTPLRTFVACCRVNFTLLYINGQICRYEMRRRFHMPNKCADLLMVVVTEVKM
jgi:hypothetical protein